METTIFYFTATGNSLMVSRDLAKELGDTKLVPIAQAITDSKIDLSDECIGFVFPIYYGSFPLIVRDFIKKLWFDRSKYIFAVCTTGAPIVNTNMVLDPFSKLISEQGGELAVGCKISLPNNHIQMFNPHGHSKQERMFKLEKQKVKEIAEKVTSRKRIGVERNLLRVFF